MKRQEQGAEFDLDYLKRYCALSAKEKLEYLEELNRFLAAAMPEESKRIWAELKERESHGSR